MEHLATHTHARDVAFAGLFIALIAVSAWVSVPIGPIPVTLQMLAIPLSIFVLRPSVAIVTIYGYVFLGAIGVPVFSQMRGGLGVLLGPTGGFLMGYLIAVPIACGFLHIARKTWHARQLSMAKGSASSRDASGSTKRTSGIFVRGLQRFSLSSVLNLMAGILFTVVADIFGCVWFMYMANVGFDVAFLTCLVPFIVPDLLKIIFASLAANALEPVAYRYAKRANV